MSALYTTTTKPYRSHTLYGFCYLKRNPSSSESCRIKYRARPNKSTKHATIHRVSRTQSYADPNRCCAARSDGASLLEDIHRIASATLASISVLGSRLHRQSTRPPRNIEAPICQAHNSNFVLWGDRSQVSQMQCEDAAHGTH